jgi:mRNA interferase MazF
VVEDDTLFDPAWPNILVVPLTNDPRLAIPGLSVVIDPTPENGCERQCFALAASVTSVTRARVCATGSRVEPAHPRDIRHRIAEVIGLVIAPD